jgi:N6-L-threonylcarbamoyladenine synthase
MLVLGIETSCDETGIALVEDGERILSAAVASQESIHAPYEGVVPELASRQHVRLLGPMLQRCMRESGVSLLKIGLVAVTRGPGLAGCLLSGVSFAKGLAYGLGVPVLGVNHIEAHIYSCRFAGQVEFPALALVVSGGHTLLALVRSWGSYELLGQTLDDAVGEAYDKVASMIGLPFPGGPAVEACAKRFDSALKTGRTRCAPMTFPRPLSESGDLNFSFSGLKTAVLYWLRKREGEALSADEVDVVAHAFQEAVVDVISKKTMRAAQLARVRSILLGGGVARNESLRSRLHEGAREIGTALHCAPKEYCTDNGVMVASLGCRKYIDGARDDWSLDITPGLRLC